jgi:hypothetical protein
MQSLSDERATNVDINNSYNSSEFQFELSKVLTNMIDLNKKYTELRREQCNDKDTIRHLESEIRRLTDENAKMNEKIILYKVQIQEATSNIADRVNYIMSNAKFKTTETRPNTNKDQFIESGETRSMNDSQTTYANSKKSEKGEITQNLAQTDADMNRIIITIDDGVEVQQSTNINANVSEENVKTAQYKYVKNTDDDIRTYADVVKNVKTSPTLPTPQTGTEKRQLMMQDPITKKWSRIEKSVMQVDTKTLQEHET